MEKYETLEKFIYQYLELLKNANIKNAEKYFFMWLNVMRNINKIFPAQFSEQEIKTDIEHFQHTLAFEDMKLYFVFHVDTLIKLTQHFPFYVVPLSNFELSPYELGQIKYSK